MMLSCLAWAENRYPTFLLYVYLALRSTFWRPTPPLNYFFPLNKFCLWRKSSSILKSCSAIIDFFTQEKSKNSNPKWQKLSYFWYQTTKEKESNWYSWNASTNSNGYGRNRALVFLHHCSIPFMWNWFGFIFVTLHKKVDFLNYYHYRTLKHMFYVLNAFIHKRIDRNVRTK